LARRLEAASGRRPETPDAPLPLTRWTAPGGAPGALLIALAVGERGEARPRSLDAALAVGQGFWPQALALWQRLGRRHPVRAPPRAACGKRLRPHAAEHRGDGAPGPFHPLALGRTGVRGAVVARI